MIKVQLEQGSEDWLAWRNGGIGSSDIAKIMGISPWGTGLDVYNEKAGISKEKKKTWAMNRGTNYEAEARDIFNANKVEELKFYPDCFQRSDYPWARASFDGYNEFRNYILEIKVPGSKDFELAARGKVPEYYNIQMQWQMFVADSDIAIYMCYRPESGETHIFPIERDDALINAMKIAAEHFWINFLKGIPPGKKRSDHDFVIDDRLADRVEEYKTCKRSFDLLQQKLEEIKSSILAYGNGQNSFMGYGITVTLAKPRTTYDMMAMQTDGIDISKYAKTSEKSSYRITID